jgi:hypothetical protein
MSGKILIESKNPKTQSIEAVKALLSWRHMPTDPMPTQIEFPGGAVVLVLGSKKDIYYAVTHDDCSCPAKCYHPGQMCKHQKKFFARDDVGIPREVIAKISQGGLELMDTVGFRPCLE